MARSLRNGAVASVTYVAKATRLIQSYEVFVAGCV